jgi:hypothetical protein
MDRIHHQRFDPRSGNKANQLEKLAELMAAIGRSDR